MADDNVFFDNTVKLLKAMQVGRKQFDLMTYPGQRHGLRGEDIRAHSMQMIVDFLKEKLDVEDDEFPGS